MAAAKLTTGPQHSVRKQKNLIWCWLIPPDVTYLLLWGPPLFPNESQFSIHTQDVKKKKTHFQLKFEKSASTITKAGGLNEKKILFNVNKLPARKIKNFFDRFEPKDIKKSPPYEDRFLFFSLSLAFI